MGRSEEEIEADLNNIAIQIEKLNNAAAMIQDAKTSYENTNEKLCKKWTDDAPDGPTAARKKKATELCDRMDKEIENISRIVNTLNGIATRIRDTEQRHSN